MAQISHPLPWDPNIPSICLKFFRVIASLYLLQHPRRCGDTKSLQAVSGPNSKGG